MNRYTIYCTEAQTKKAFELGAPIEYQYDYIDEWVKCKVTDSDGEPLLVVPTAEQMTGWLEEQNIFILINLILEKGYRVGIKRISDNMELRTDIDDCTSRKEAILAAIDAALEYLANKK